MQVVLLPVLAPAIAGIVVSKTSCSEHDQHDDCHDAFEWHFAIFGVALLAVGVLEPPTVLERCKGDTQAAIEKKSGERVPIYS